MKKVSAYISKYKLYFKLMSVSGLNIGVHRSITIMKHSVLITDCVRDKSNIYLPKKRLFLFNCCVSGSPAVCFHGDDTSKCQLPGNVNRN